MFRPCFVADLDLNRPVPTVNNNKIRFDGWVLDLDSGDLGRDGNRLRLQEQPLQVLRELISRAGGVVTREQLIALLWPKGVVDFDTGLNTAIRKLRSALGDTAETPRYIETLPRRGYRFIARIDPEEPSPMPSVPQALSTPADGAPAVLATGPAPEPATNSDPRQVSPAAAALPGPAWRSGWAAVAIILALLASAALFMASSLFHPWRNPFANARFSRLTDLNGKEQAAAISRDGKHAVFVSDHDGQNDVWITEIGSGRYRNLTQGKALELVNPAIRTLGFSPDASQVTVWQRSSGGARSGDINIAFIPSGGGSLQRYLPEAAEAVWSNDGKRILYHTSAPGDPMFIKDSPQAEPRRIYTAQAPMHCHFQIWSPDDAYIYMVCGVPQAGWDIWRIRADGSNAERITWHDALVSHVVALDARTLAYLAADGDGTGQGLYVVDVKRREPHRVSSGLERYSSLAASADGKQLLVTVAHPKSSLWRVSIADPAGSARAAVRVVADATVGLSPRVGQASLLFVSSRGGRQGIWKLAGGTSSELWTHPQQSVMGAPAVASDGGRIAFTASDGVKTFLYVMQSDGSQARVLIDSLPLRGSPAWSPDGLSVVIAVAHEGMPRLVAIYLNGAPPAVLVSEYSLDPAWSPDGHFLVYSGADVGTTFPLRAVASDGKPYALPVPILTRGARRVVFSRDGQAIVVLRGEIGHKNFWSIDLNSGAERQRTVLPPDFDVRDFDLSADGTEILFDRVEANSEIALIERGR
jgi:DNA-binding winged helix-turn-helix (wHTH) protein/Tol biopolymer transport system component